MEQAGNTVWILLAFNVLLGIASFFGAIWLRRMEADMRDMQKSHGDQIQQANHRELALHEKLNNYVAKDDFREFRDENRRNFETLFARIDSIAGRVPHPQRSGS